MGIDASLFFHPGEPLAFPALVAAMRPIVTGRLGAASLAAAHIADVVPPRAGVRFQAIALFERPTRAVRVEREAIDQVAAEASESSLASLVQRAFVMAREAPLDASPARALLPDDWCARVAAALSKRRRRALWACVCDHSLVGGYALASEGEVLEQAECLGDAYAERPNRALQRFTGVADIAVGACLRTPIDTGSGLDFALLAEDGALLKQPRVIARARLREYQHVLLEVGAAVRLVVR